MSTFGAPIYGDPQAENAGAGAAQPSDAPQEVLDPNDPRLASEALDVNAAGDAYAQPTPPPDARYRARLKLAQVEDDKQQKHDFLPKMHARQGPYFFGSIEAHIIDPSGKYDGIVVYDGWVGTFKQRDGSTKVSTILACLKRPDGEPWFRPTDRLSQRDWMQLFVRALAGEPEVAIETTWEWSCQVCGEEAKKAGRAYPRSITGMNKFPVDGKTKAYLPEMRCQVSQAHGYSRARPRIARVLPVSVVATGAAK